MKSGRVADGVFVCIAVLLGGMAMMFYFKAPVETRAEVFPKGSQLPVEYQGASGRGQLLVAFQSECRYCIAGTAFYAELAAYCRERGVDFRVITADPPDVVRVALSSALVHGGSVIQASLLNVRGTPAVVLVDSANRVVASWLGWLSPDLEDEVLGAVGRMGAVGAGASETPPATPDEPAQDEVQSAARWIERAGDFLGGAAKLKAVDRLHLTVTESQSQPPHMPRTRIFKLWLPDRFQSDTELYTHTLRGSSVHINREVPPEARTNAEEALPALFRRVAMAFLLRAPGLGAPRVEADARVGDLRGALVEFTAQDGRHLRLLLAHDTAAPLALVYSTRVLGTNESLPDQVWRLEDYREVDGLRFPFRLTLLHPRNLVITQVQRVEVNPRFADADFPR